MMMCELITNIHNKILRVELMEEYLWHPVNAIEAEGYCGLVPDRQISMQAKNLDSKSFARSHERHSREAPITKDKKFRDIANRNHLSRLAILLTHDNSHKSEISHLSWNRDSLTHEFT